MARNRVFSHVCAFACAALAVALGPAAWASQKSLHDIDDGINSKKGLQVQMVDDALALGVHHAAINVNLVQLAPPAGGRDNETLDIDGRHFEFNHRYVQALDSKINPLSAHGITVYLILLAYKTPKPELARVFLHPKFNPESPSPISAFNTSDEIGANQFRASVTFLARRYAKADAPPVHFIAGNEVNSHWFWYNMGEATMDAVAEDYERSVRICHDAIRAVSPTSRVYLSLDHNWSAGVTPKEPLKSFGGRAFLEAFSKLAKRNGDFEWHLAFHSYPESLFDARTWNDKHATMSDDAPKITFKNIEVLNDFMKRPELAFEGKPRRIILSEQGFNTSKAADGEEIQAAAFAYSYRKVENLDGIDAFILHRHVDNTHEGGLSLGLWTCDAANNPLKKKMIYDVFRLADTAHWKEAFQICAAD